MISRPQVLVCDLLGCRVRASIFLTSILKPTRSRLLTRAAVVHKKTFLAGQKARVTAIPDLAGKQLVGLWLQVDLVSKLKKESLRVPRKDWRHTTVLPRSPRAKSTQ